MYVARYPEWDVNVGVVAGDDGLLVVDTRAGLRQGEVLRDDVGRLAPHAEVRWVINTHCHFDHVLGNAAFEDAIVCAHENAAAAIGDHVAYVKARIGADPDPDPDHPEITAAVLTDVTSSPVRVPDTTLASVRAIDLGDRVVEIMHPGRGHTDGDVVVVVPDAQVVFAGDLVEEAGPPGYGSDSFPLDWADSLDLAMGVLTAQSLVVPGHGAPVDRDFVERQLTDIAAVAQMIRELARRGVPVAEALGAGNELPRRGSLAAAYGVAEPAGEQAATGWPFDPAVLDDAVRRGYAQLGLPGTGDR